MVAPMLRGLIAPVAALVGASALLGYLSSCSADKQMPPEAPVASKSQSADGEPEGETPEKDEKPPKVATLRKIVPDIPTPEAPKPTPAQANEIDRRKKTVADVLDSGCTTSVVMGLSEQIVAEANCMDPGAYARLPELPNLTLSKAVFPYMQAPARDAFAKAVEGSKRKMKINSMLRTVAQQYLLYDWYKRKRCGIKLAAKPGKSNHQSGLAIDISEPGNWKKSLRRQGFRWMGKKDPWHFDYRGDEAKDRRGLDLKAFQRLWNRNHPNEPVGTDGDWGPDTEEALRLAPAEGFALGPQCEEAL